MTIRHDVQAEDLIRYGDGDLHGGRRELVEAHLQHCPVCQRWLADFEDTARLLRENAPPFDDAAARARIMARIATTPGRPHRKYPRTLAVFAALTLALIVTLAMPWQRSEARMSVGRFFQFVERGAQRSSLVGGVTPTIAPRPVSQPLSPEGIAALPFAPQTVPALPLGLRLDHGVITHRDELALYYRNDRGLVILLTQRRAGDGGQTRTTTGELVVIGGVDVVVQTERRTRAVGVMTWKDRGTLYELSADQAPEGPPSLAEAHQIVEALLAGR